MAFRLPAFNDAKTYGFEWLRLLLEFNLQEGVLGPGDLKVTPSASGNRVDLAAGYAAVKGDSGTASLGLTQGLFAVVNDAPVVNVAMPAQDATNPRIDLVCVRVRDSSDLATGADDAGPLVVAGTPTAGATLDNMAGAAALPNDCILLAAVLTPAGVGLSTISPGNVRDRRRFARGAYSYTRRVANAGGGSNYTTTSTSYVPIDSTNLARRVELGGGPVRVRMTGAVQHTAVGRAAFSVLYDGAVLDGNEAIVAITATATGYGGSLYEYEFVPGGAGSHVFVPQFNAVQAGTLTLFAQAAQPLTFIVTEIARGVGDNT
jgi:hypothetical protein